MELITLADISINHKISRNTISKKMEKYNIKTYYVETNTKPVRHKKAIDVKELSKIVNIFGKKTEDDPKTKCFAKTKGFQIIKNNIELGLYNRISDYGGTYDARKWAV